MRVAGEKASDRRRSIPAAAAASARSSLGERLGEAALHPPHDAGHVAVQVARGRDRRARRRAPPSAPPGRRRRRAGPAGRRTWWPARAAPRPRAAPGGAPPRCAPAGRTRGSSGCPSRRTRRRRTRSVRGPAARAGVDRRRPGSPVEQGQHLLAEVLELVQRRHGERVVGGPLEPGQRGGAAVEHPRGQVVGGDAGGLVRAGPVLGGQPVGERPVQPHLAGAGQPGEHRLAEQRVRGGDPAVADVGQQPRRDRGVDELQHAVRRQAGDRGDVVHRDRGAGHRRGGQQVGAALGQAEEPLAQHVVDRGRHGRPRGGRRPLAPAPARRTGCPPRGPRSGPAAAGSRSAASAWTSSVMAGAGSGPRSSRSTRGSRPTAARVSTSAGERRPPRCAGPGPARCACGARRRPARRPAGGWPGRRRAGRRTPPGRAGRRRPPVPSPGRRRARRTRASAPSRGPPHRAARRRPGAPRGPGTASRSGPSARASRVRLAASSRTAAARTICSTGQNGGAARPSRQVAERSSPREARTAPRSTSSSADLPIPASPVTRTTDPDPADASATARASTAHSCSRPRSCGARTAGTGAAAGAGALGCRAASWSRICCSSRRRSGPGSRPSSSRSRRRPSPRTASASACRPATYSARASSARACSRSGWAATCGCSAATAPAVSPSWSVAVARSSTAARRRVSRRSAAARANGSSANSPNAGPRQSASASSTRRTTRGVVPAEQPGRLGHQRLEPVGVELQVLARQPVARGGGDDHGGVGAGRPVRLERPSEVGDLGVQRGRGLRRRFAVPQQVGEPVRRDDAAGLEHQDREQRPFHARPEGNGGAVQPHLQRPEDADLHAATGPAVPGACSPRRCRAATAWPARRGRRRPAARPAPRRPVPGRRPRPCPRRTRSARPPRRR